MRRTFVTLCHFAALTGLTACSVQDTRLDEAIRQYVGAREAQAEAACKCYQLFLNLYSNPATTFTSEAECLDVLLPAPEDDAIKCMKSILDSSNSGTADSIDSIDCYTETLSETTDCYTQNAEQCSQSACSSDGVEADTCRGQLTPDEATALYWCAAR